MKKSIWGYFLSSSLLFSLMSCSQTVSGRINFSLEGGTFNDATFATTYLEGQAGTPVKTEIPTPVKEGYYFVGWREKTSSGSYRNINKRQYEDGNYYYYYPYGSDTFYAYFEPLITLTFDLAEGNDGAKLIAPKYEASNFNSNKLSGYAAKTIPSTDYLPTADGSDIHLNFEYWYTKYPLIGETDETHTEHYRLDTTKAEGRYRFDQSFSSNMAFPIDDDVTLYAYWTKDPTITIVYNLDGYENENFQAKDSLSEELTALMKDMFDIDFTTQANRYYFIQGEINKRFGGFFLDSEFKSQFFLDSPIASLDFTLYLKWENKINVTLDYNGGTLNGESKHVLTDYYEGDTLTNEIFTQYIPNSDTGSFSCYQYNGSEFSFENTVLPGNDLTLYAKYDAYPLLTLIIDYPTDYSGETIDSESYSVPIGNDISNFIESFKSSLTDASLEFNSTYTLNNGEKHSCPSTMPTEDLTIYCQYDFLSKVSITTYANTDTTYSLQEDIPAYEAMFTKDANGLPQDIDIHSFVGIQDDMMIDGKTYLFDGIYSDSDLLEETCFPLYQEPSHSQQMTISLYRKMTQGIKLSFYSYASLTTLNKSLFVLPGKPVSTYDSQLSSLLGSYKNLYVLDGMEMVKLGSYLPQHDIDIYVES